MVSLPLRTRDVEPLQPAPDRFDVELVGVSRRFGAVAAVDDLSLRVEGGSFYSLLGPSGCGKTTTLRLIAGFEQPDRGDIRIAGRSVAGVPPYRRNVNTVFQHYALFPHMDVADNVGYGLKQRHVPEDERIRRVGAALELVRLSGYGRRRTWQLSGGQQQRVALARALINEPTVLLLDEPLGALDLKLRREMQHELKALQLHTGITFIYVTHDQEEALTMSDRLAVLRAGRIVQEGTPRELYERPADRYVAAFIGLSNFFPGRVVAAGPRIVIETASGLRIGARQPPDAASPLAEGATATVAVRPEWVRLGAPGEDGIVGRLIEATFLGDATEYRVETESLGTVVARRQTGGSGPASTGHVVGEAVTVGWDESAALALPE